MFKYVFSAIAALVTGVCLAGDPFYDAPAVKSSALYVSGTVTTNTLGTTNLVAFQAYDVAGKAFAGYVAFNAWLGVSTSNPTNDDCDVATVVSGTLLKTITATNSFSLLTDATGAASIRLVDAVGKTNAIWTVTGSGPARAVALPW